jgi:hypothetical protein
MKLLIMPTAKQMREADGDFESIVAAVLKLAPGVTANRKITLQNPSVYRAEFDHEIEELRLLRTKLQINIELANAKQRERLDRLKQKYDREGV